MEIKVSSVFECAIAEVVREVRTTRLLEYVTRAFMRFVPVEPPRFPEEWSAGEYRIRMRVMRFIPFGYHYIVIQDIKETDESFTIRDNGRGDMVRVWDHRITASRRDDGRVDYTDEIEVKAGALTPFVALFAAAFYRYRQRRWKRLIRNGFDYRK